MMLVVDISMGIIAFAFVVLVIALLVAISKIMRILKTSNRTMKNIEHITDESKSLVKNANDLTADIKEKSESLNFLFRPLSRLNKSKSNPQQYQAEKIAAIINYATDTLMLFNKLKKKKKK
jgi:uncharacterized protein YoxC